MGRGWVAQNQGRLKIRYEKGFGLPMLLKNSGKGFKKAKANHEKGFGRYMVPKSGVGMVGGC